MTTPPRAGDFKIGARHRGRQLLAILFVGNLAVWLWAFAAFAHRPALLGLAFVAWLYGLRHAVDADHIAAIDNVVRKLMEAGRRSYAVGFFFSLGHSTVVVIASVVVAVVAKSALDAGPLGQVRDWGAIAGTAVSAATLLLVAAANLVTLRRNWQALRQARGPHPVLGSTGSPDASTGLLARLFRPLFALVTRSWHMYPVGFLFGLGFDTATEIALLGIAASEAAHGLALDQLLVFPTLFTAGMALVDSADSVLMVGAYGWAFVEPRRKLWYNVIITGGSVAVALMVGGIEVGGLFADRLGLTGRVAAGLQSLNGDLDQFGFVVVGLFAAAWAISVLLDRWRRRPTTAPTRPQSG